MFNFKMNVGISKNSDIYNKIKKNGLKKNKNIRNSFYISTCQLKIPRFFLKKN